jgi:hypothetical protein
MNTTLVVGDKLLNAIKYVHRDEWDSHFESLWTSLINILVEKILAGSHQIAEVSLP